MDFQRNQLAWAISRAITPAPSSTFEREITLKLQRLLDKDRAMSLEPSHQRHAFLEGDLPGKGTVVRFTEETAFQLLLGLLLLDSGLTQSRVVRLIRDLGNDLARQYQWIVAHSPAALRGTRDEGSWRRDLQRGRFAVARSHLSFVVVTGNLADQDGTVEHRLCRNSDQLISAIAELSLAPRPLICIELTNRAWAIWHWLTQAPVITRGRRPAS